MTPRAWICLALALAAAPSLTANAGHGHVFDTPTYKITLMRVPEVDFAPWRASIVDKRNGKTSEWSFENPSTVWHEARVFGDRAILLGAVAELTGDIAILNLSTHKEEASWYGEEPAISPDGKYVAYIGQKPTHGPDAELPDELFIRATVDPDQKGEVRIFRLGEREKAKLGGADQDMDAIEFGGGLVWVHGGRDLAFLVSGTKRLRLFVAKHATDPQTVEILERDVDRGKGTGIFMPQVESMKDAGGRQVVIEIKDMKTHTSRAVTVPLPGEGQ